MHHFWKKFEQVENKPHYLTDEISKYCYFAREYLHEGYEISNSNQIIFNFKKPKKEKNSWSWKYKEDAAFQFAKELHELFLGKKGRSREFILATIPTSKLDTHQEYDNRFEMMIEHLIKLGEKNNIKYIYEQPIQLKDNTKSSHSEKGSRNVNEKYKNYEWKGFKHGKPKSLIIIDDVISTGAQFMAYRKLLLEKIPTIQCFGLFWARTTLI